MVRVRVRVGVRVRVRVRVKATQEVGSAGCETVDRGLCVCIWPRIENRLLYPRRSLTV